MKSNLSLACLLLVTCGCTLFAQDQLSNQEHAAIIVNPSKQSNDEIATAIAKLLGQKKVLLAASAFTKNSSITIARAAHQTSAGQLINGRITEQPLLILLVKKGQQCFVKNALTGEKLALKVSKCREWVN